MIVLDFLFYYLTLWYEEHRYNLKWSTPMERAVYVMGIITILWVISILEVFEIFIVKSPLIDEIPFVSLVAAGIGILMLLRYIYLTKRRYKKVFTLKFKFISDKQGKLISIAFLFLSVILPFLLFMVFTS